MPRKKIVLERLNRAELLSFVAASGVEVSDRRSREKLVDALAASRRARLSEFLVNLPRDRLKQLATALEVPANGREKSAIVERIVGN